MTDLAAQEYWDKAYEDLTLKYDSDQLILKELFEIFLEPGGSCFEVGCYPGSYLAYLGKRFDYTVSGIDTTPFVLSRLPVFLRDQQVKIGALYHGDFLKFKPQDTYDVVCSFGFIEHFVNFEEVIGKHVQLLHRDGLLVLACPNFTGLQFPLHWLLDRDNLNRHFPPSMDLGRWTKVLEHNGMKILRQGYYKTFDFWVDASRRGCVSHLLIDHIQRIATQIDRRVNWPNSLLSPYIFSFSRKC